MIAAKVIATCFALVAFAAALIVGIAVGNPAGTVLWRALLTLALCWPIGYVVGSIAGHMNHTAIEAYKKQNPMEEDPTAGDDSSSPVELDSAATERVPTQSEAQESSRVRV